MEHQKPYTIRDDVNLPLMSDGPMASPVHKLIAHGVGKVMSSFLCISLKNSVACILILEYSYFYLESNEEDPIGVFASAVKEYQSSGTQAAVCKALRKAIQAHENNEVKLQAAIMGIILNSRMCE